MGFSRQEYWSGLPFPLPGNLPDPGSNPHLWYLLHWQADSLLLSHLGSLEGGGLLSKMFNSFYFTNKMDADYWNLLVTGSWVSRL